jgi:hypothetical protein
MPMVTTGSGAEQKRIIIRAGSNISPQEVEEVLCTVVLQYAPGQ